MPSVAEPTRPLQLPNRFEDPIRRGVVGLVRPAVERVLCFGELNDAYEETLGRDERIEANQRILQTLQVRCEVAPRDLEHIPKTGGLVVVANHPFGGIEGLVLAAMLKRTRPDVKLLANHLLSMLPMLRDNYFFVDPFDRADSLRRNLAPMREALRWVRSGGVLGVFPSGEVSHPSFRTRMIADPAWSETVARLIRRTDAPVLPVFFDGRNSLSFQLLGMVHPRLRTIMLPRELLNKRRRTLRVAVGNLIPFDRLQRFASPGETIAYLRARTYLLKARLSSAAEAMETKRPRPVQEPVAAPQDPATLAAEVEGLGDDHRLVGSGEHDVFLAQAPEIPRLMLEIGRLREITFRAAGEGTGRSIDLDRFDDHYMHLFAWNHARGQLVGAYRIGATDEILPTYGVDGLYTSTLFRFKSRLLRQIDPALEMGRSFVRAEYQRNHAPLMLLWKGIGHYVAANPRYRMLFGPVSITNQYQSTSKRLLIAFLRAHRGLPIHSRLIRPKHPVRWRPRSDWPAKQSSVIVQDVRDVDELIREIEADRRSMPVLLRQYLKLNARLLGFNVDPDFGDVVDGLMLVDLTRVDRRVLRQYLGKENAAAFLAHHGKSR